MTRSAAGLIIVTVVLWLAVLAGALASTVECGTFEANGAWYGFCVARGM
jgi:hypothetical protein